ncbi:unnamed protein product [Arabidopsis thaliana]|uniref:(thale cress) hypothetical protein n=1 Tax=Arabidopsis thaliana TaxID=3702 RepID=A0A7G2EW90_ARATH|nr:unnamed protein product [Arabidopsis thaliana]
MSYLVLKDNIRASAVCRAWRKAAESVRVVEKHPWVISFPRHYGVTILFDPLGRKSYTLNLPELVGTDVCYSKDGWLLMRRSSLVDMFFLNPYTRELINLPKCELSFQAVAFSSAPTSAFAFLEQLSGLLKIFLALMDLSRTCIAILSMPMVTSIASARKVF